MTTPSTDLKSIGQILVPVSDVDRAVSFYADVLGLPVLMRFPGIAFMDAAGVRSTRRAWVPATSSTQK